MAEMGKYWGYITASYGITAIFIAVLAGAIIADYRRQRRLLDALKEQHPPAGRGNDRSVISSLKEKAQ